MIENLYRCCSCKNKSIIRCIKCDVVVRDRCGCNIPLKSTLLELEIKENYPNIILYICDDCKNNILENVKNGDYGNYY